MKSNRKSVIADIFIILLIAVLGTLLRFPGDGSAAARAEGCTLSDPDSYLYARRAAEYAEDPGAVRLFTRRSEDPLMSLADSGSDAFVPNLLSMCAAAVSRVSGADVHTVVFCLCAVLGALAGVPAYVFVRRRTNACGGIVAGLSTALSASYLGHSLPGCFDTDGAIALLAVSLFTAFGECLLAEDRRRQAGYGALSLALFIIFAFTWEAYFAYLGILLLCLAVTLPLLRRCRAKAEGTPRSPAAVPAVTAGLMVFAFLLISGRNAVTSLSRSAYLVFGSQDWPASSAFTAELAAAPLVSGGFAGSFDASLPGIVNRLGGFAAFTGAAAAAAWLICAVIRAAKGRETILPGADSAVCTGVFVTWLLLSFPFVKLGQRFIQLPALPMCLLCGLGAGAAAKGLGSRGEEPGALRYLCTGCGILIFGSLASVNFALGLICGIAAVVLALVFKRRVPALVSVLLAVSMLISPVLGAVRTARSGAPLVTPALEDACLWLRENTEEDAVIISWWDYGYYFQYAAERRTVADGGSDSGELYFWLADALVTEDSALSAAECRMLACGGADASKMAAELTGSAKAGAELLKKILPLSREEARRVVIEETEADSAEADALLSLSHPREIPDTYLVIYGGMRSIMGAMGWFASWDFRGGGSAPTDGYDNSMVMKVFSGNVPFCFDRVFTSGDSSVIILKADRPQ